MTGICKWSCRLAAEEQYGDQLRVSDKPLSMLRSGGMLRLQGATTQGKSLATATEAP
jgi:hypothetical protein